MIRVIAFLLALLGVATAQTIYNSGGASFSPPAITCTNQFIRSIAAATGIGTCASIAAGDFPTLTGDVTTPGGSLATTLAASARLKSNTITVTRDLTVATGSVAYTGMGFQPTSCLASGDVANSLTQYVNIFSMSDSSRNTSSTALGASIITVQTTIFLNYLDTTGSNFQQASITSYDADGFTLSWVKTGTPTGTATTKVMCFR